MKFNNFAKIYESVSQDALQGILQQTLNPNIVSQVMSILLSHQQSKLTQFILGRASDPEKNPPHKFEIKKLSTLEAYKLDPVVYDRLLHVVDNGIGPGEVLIALVGGTWKGGTQANYDVLLPEIGKVEIKYLKPFAHSTNVPLGSSHDKNVENTEFSKIVEEIGNIIRSTPQVLKGKLNPDEMDYFIRQTIDQIFNSDKNLSTNSIRLIARILRNAEKQNSKEFSQRGITFSKLTKSMNEAIHKALGDSPYLMFIGDRTIPSGNLLVPGKVEYGQYYIMPKEDVKYYMLCRMYKHERIKIAPFSTEREFLEKTIND
jgi:hypothetical protein